ncbi:hypothetical protein PA598K_05633 [Paenibacillus sp. 598K]|uniref:hypothetical protein n=1 Tax=Paenibacillus sp. 598K TaxID=1117987 RepID=UPI000FFB0524|nr:hypothetical protein [Paenibacillus sp. 598K]GBF77109.1 hypothetical protein PA598K_05633 [Paenibacillus sp. 598K]
MSVNKHALAVFTGTTPNIGTTAAAFATAAQVASLSSQPVGLLCLNLKSAKLHRYLGVDRPSVTLDSLRPELRAGTLTPDKLRSAAYTPPSCPGLSILFGNLMRDQAEFFTPEDMEHLLAVARQTYRLTVADVSAYWDNAATITAMRAADSRLVAMSTALSSFQEDGQRWIGQVAPLFGVKPLELQGIVIHPPWKNGGFPVKDIRRETGLTVVEELKVTESLLSQLDSGRLDNWVAAEQQGKQAMRRTAEHLMARHVIAGVPGRSSQPWYRKLMGHRNGVTS